MSRSRLAASAGFCSHTETKVRSMVCPKLSARLEELPDVQRNVVNMTITEHYRSHYRVRAFAPYDPYAIGPRWFAAGKTWLFPTRLPQPGE